MLHESDRRRVEIQVNNHRDLAIKPESRVQDNPTSLRLEQIKTSQYWLLGREVTFENTKAHRDNSLRNV